MSRGRRNKFWIVSSRLRTAIFQNIRENRTLYNANQIQGDIPTWISDLHLQQKEIDK